ncbi:helix-turn-helix domain-containing protein [Pleomorphomonas koreensis]|uniref:helix-turn-helix domain-containing protein n=1 Tax=Pleomorphomonas koreensis TaxID=257440 RepID=UPI0004280CB7|nr:helix-turn-helix domain-containing protein [Pleomorphomonas koreensis]
MTARLSVMTVVKTVSEVTGVSTGDILGRRRAPVYANARKIAYYLARKHCPEQSFPVIGRIMGGRDHSTVMWGEARIRAALEKGTKIPELVQADLALMAARDSLSLLEMDDAPDHDPLEIAGRAKTKRGASMLTIDEIQALATFAVYTVAFDQLTHDPDIDAAGLPVNVGQAILRVVAANRAAQAARFGQGEASTFAALNSAVANLEAAYRAEVEDGARVQSAFKYVSNAPRKEANHA